MMLGYLVNEPCARPQRGDRPHLTAFEPASREAMCFGLMVASVLNALIGSIIVLMSVLGNLEAVTAHQCSVSGAALLGVACACLCAERVAAWIVHQA